ncbi:MAG: galactokinase [Pseudomonadota bacterium]|nr:MAG: galactokinase [Pseudomonadota bacterium]
MSESDFLAAFGRLPSATADAAGRVNLMGEHTDYNGGRVLPTAIPGRTRVWLARRDDGRVQAGSAAVGGAVESYTLGAESPRGTWLDYLQGITAELVRGGQALSGLDLWIESDVPVGSGLASSAAFEIAVLRGLRALYGLLLDDLELARLGQRAETRFVGANVGIMDQMAAVFADEHTALLLDTRTLAFERVPLPDTLEIGVIDSGVRHAHASGGYNERREECERAAALLGVRSLCELSVDALPRVLELPEPLARRARHAITEHARVGAAADALRAGDGDALRALFTASHASQRDDFAVSVPEVDRLVSLALKDEDVVAARLTGGGFGGSIVFVASRGRAHTAALRVLDAAALPHARVVVPARASHG